MKIILLFLLIMNTAFATMDHSTRMAQKPSQKQLTFTRGCFKEIQELGCSHPREGMENFRNCLTLQRENLGQDCQSFFNKLYGEK